MSAEDPKVIFIVNEEQAGNPPDKTVTDYLFDPIEQRIIEEGKLQDPEID